MHSQRKLDHLRTCLEEDVAFKGISTGLERYRIIHQALPELALDEVDLSCSFLGHELKAPLLVSAMTGGTPAAQAINRNLAIAAKRAGIAMSVGSQRAALDDPQLVSTYFVRDVAPDILLFANLGAVQLNYGYGLDECERAVEMLQADGLTLHLNPLQECLQDGGNTDFRGLLNKIKAICTNLSVPVIVKEVGWGLSAEVARALVNAGVSVLDVAGAGGTSWAEVEKFRSNRDDLRRVAESFHNWGISTVDSIRFVRESAPRVPLIASGGIRTGVDIIKALCLGANIAGIALPFLPLAADSSAHVAARLDEIILEMRIALMCSGVRTLRELDLSKLYTS